MDQTDSATGKSRVIGGLVIVAGALGATMFRMPPDPSAPLERASQTRLRGKSAFAVRVAEGQENDVVLRDSSALPPADIATLSQPDRQRERAIPPRPENGTRPQASAPPSMPSHYGRLGGSTNRAELKAPARQMTPKKRAPRMRTEHRLRDGDTLESIATRYYGDPRRAADIFEANRNLLPSRNLLPLNVTIKLPSRDSLPPISDPSNAPRASPKTRTTLGSVR